MERRNRKRIEELVANLQDWEKSMNLRKADLWSLISPFIQAAKHSQASRDEIGAVVEIRQMMLSLYNDPMFQKITEVLKGRDVPTDRTRGWIAHNIVYAIRDTRNTYEYRKTRYQEAEDALSRYVKNYLVRRDGYRNPEMLNEIIAMLPDCFCRYNLMESREYLLNMEAGR